MTPATPERLRERRRKKEERDRIKRLMPGEIIYYPLPVGEIHYPPPLNTTWWREAIIGFGVATLLAVLGSAFVLG